MTTAIDLTSSHEEIELILALARHHEGVKKASEPTALDASSPLNAGFGAEIFSPEIFELVRHTLEFVTVVFSSGTAALGFLKAVREQKKARGGLPVAVHESASGKHLGRLEAGTEDEDLRRIVPS